MPASLATDGAAPLPLATAPLPTAPSGAGSRAAYDVVIDEPRDGALRTVVRLFDRGTVVNYTLGARGSGGRWAFGFVEHAPDPDGGTVRTPVSAAEVMAIAREVGREHEVAEMVEDALPYASARNARRLRAELADGRNLERVALPRIQAAILRLLADGLTISELAERGGFVTEAARGRGKCDTSWLQRRAGLAPHVCRTGKRRTARTADYDVMVMLVRAVGGDPVDYGV